MTRLCVTLCVLVGLSGAQAAVGPQQDPPLVPARGEGLVHVPVVVRDEAGEPVRDLPPEAFALFEAGRRMSLVAVQPVRRAADADTYVPREILLVVDDLSIRAEVMPRAVDALRDLLDRVDPRDRLALVNSSSQPALRVDFTTTRTPLRQALARVRGQDLPDRGFARWRDARALGVLGAVLQQFGREDAAGSRLAVVLVSEGFGLAPIEQSGMVDPELLQEVRRTVGLAARANAVIYAIDPAGLDPARSPVRSTGSRAIGPATAMRRAGMPISSSLRAPDDVSALGAIAHDTGGRLTRGTNDLLAQVPDMLRDVDEYYLLSYEMPGAGARDRSAPAPHVRQIEVRVHRPNLTVRARQGYVHPAATR